MPTPSRPFRSRRSPARSRRLLLEPLEDRSLLAAVITVNSTLDTDARDAVLTFREAIEINNATLDVASLTAQEQSQVAGTLSNSDADTIGFNVLVSDSRHYYYQNDNLAGQVSLAKITATTAADDSSIMDIDPDWPHSWFSIQPTNPWPALAAAAGPVVIDGYSESGAAPNTLADASNAVLRIEIDGINPPHSVTGRLDIQAGSSTVRGLVLNHQPGGTTALYLGGTGGSIVSGNFIGTDVSGTLTGRGNDQGIQVSSDGNTIGGALPAARNIISNNATGVRIDGSSNVVAGNIVGLDRRGLSGVGTLSSTGVEIASGTANTIGGTVPGTRNVISGHFIGVRLSSDSNIVQGNLIGTDVTGNAAIGKSSSGISVSGDKNLIGGVVLGARNVISGNATGINVVTAVDTVVQGNFIGTNATGTATIGNTIAGIKVLNHSDNMLIGGTVAGAGNLISGNRDGVWIGVADFGSTIPTNGALIQGNLIGTDASGTLDLGNTNDGVVIGTNAIAVTIGGNTTSARNVISGNDANGVSLASSGHTVQGK